MDSPFTSSRDRSAKFSITWSPDALLSLENAGLRSGDMAAMSEVITQASVSMSEFEEAARETRRSIIALFRLVDLFGTPDSCSPDTSQPYPF